MCALFYHSLIYFYFDKYRLKDHFYDLAVILDHGWREKLKKIRNELKLLN